MVYEFDNNVLLVHMRLFILVPVMFCEDSLVFVLRYIFVLRQLETTVHVLYVHTAYICTQYTVQYYLMTIIL